MRNPLPWNRTVMVLATGAAILLANVFFWSHEHIPVHDARGYYELAKIIGENGVFRFSDDKHTMDPAFHVLFELRTYGYPLFVAICSLFTNHDKLAVQIVVFNMQLLIYILTCHFAAKCLGSVFRAPGFTTCLYTCTVLNPFLLIYATELLTDLLSAVTIYLVLVLVLKAGLDRGRYDDPSGEPCDRPQQRLRIVFIASVLAGFSAMLRPANVSIVLALLVIFSMGVALTRRLPLIQLVAMGLGLAIPFVPQLANNYRTFHKIQPIVVGNLRQEQLLMGVRFLKYGTVVIGNEDPRLCYDNPFIRPSISKPADFLRKRPLGYALTLLLHAFALVDQDFPFPYIRDLHPWYRWPLSILNYVFLAGVIYGILMAIRRFARRRRVDKETFAALAILIMSVSYLTLYIPCDAENRFSLPLLLLWSPFFVNGLLRLRLVLASRCYQRAGRAAVSLVVFVGCCIWLSSWMQMQAPRLRDHAEMKGRAEIKACLRCLGFCGESNCVT
jgi:hypothetical protein